MLLNVKSKVDEIVFDTIMTVGQSILVFISRDVIRCCDIHSKKRTTCSGLMKTALNNVLLPTLFKVVNNIVQHSYTWLQVNSGPSTCSVLLTTLNNVGSTTLFNAVFMRPEQVVRFLLCRYIYFDYSGSTQNDFVCANVTQLVSKDSANLTL